MPCLYLVLLRDLAYLRFWLVVWFMDGASASRFR
ncbi:hypothetical protein MED222_05370 [Vibrio sp. MED222]|nr:hypothetical protein MED222_05370 [Vibrio sp. MED222]